MLTETIAVVLIPFVVQLLKKVLNERWSPVVAFLLGIAFGVGDYFISGGALIDMIIKGVAVGGVSTGLYAVTKTSALGN